MRIIVWAVRLNLDCERFEMRKRKDPEIGPEIRKLRRANALNLEALSRRCGLSIGYLSQIERGLTLPSVHSLHEIAAALKVTPSWFFAGSEAQRTKEGGIVVRRERRRQISYGSGVTDYLLSPSLDQKIELILSVLEPGARWEEEPVAFDVEESGFVISGRLTVWIGQRKIVLNAGDSFILDSQSKRKFLNPGSATTQVLWAVTPPYF
jgi:transcriptional regulator with XRE-family HTH domain